MTTEEEKALAELLREKLDDEDLSLIYTPEPDNNAPDHSQGMPGSEDKAPASRGSHHKNRRWRQLNLKIKIIAGVLLAGILLTGGILSSGTQKHHTETAASPNPQSSAANSQTKLNKSTRSSVSDTTGQPTEAKKPALSITPAPITAAPTVTPTITPTPAALPDDWNLVLVNPWNPIPEDFTVELQDIEHGHSVDARIAESLEKMLADARSQGLSPVICSSYRTMEKQQTLYTNKVNEYLSQGYTQENAESEAGKWVAVPGTSEHQTGLAVDIVSSSYQILDQKQEETAEQKWLMENSYKYGFILRYPNAKRDITGIYYEPWHYRYVGYKTAKEIYEKDICYEEYLETLQEA